MKAIIEAKKRGDCPISIELVISNKKQAKGLKIAQENHIPTHVVIAEDYHEKKDYEKAILTILNNQKIDWIVLAGYMKLIGPTILDAFKDKIINIHPSLLPRFKGLNAQKQAFDAGVKQTGCTVHFVDESLDGGAIIAQETVAVSDDDTLESLTEKILQKEHQLYPKVLQQLAQGIIKKNGTKMVFCKEKKEQQ